VCGSVEFSIVAFLLCRLRKKMRLIIVARCASYTPLVPFSLLWFCRILACLLFTGKPKNPNYGHWALLLVWSVVCVPYWFVLRYPCSVMILSYDRSLDLWDHPDPLSLTLSVSLTSKILIDVPLFVLYWLDFWFGLILCLGMTWLDVAWLLN
jgi:hypothetical protein